MRRMLVLLALAVAPVSAQAQTPVREADLDLSAFPAGSKVLEIAQTEKGEPITFCARPTRQLWIQLAGPPTIKWVVVPIKPQARQPESRVPGALPPGSILVQIEIPGPPGKEWTVEGIECSNRCPQGAQGSRCVRDPRYPCPVCVP